MAARASARREWPGYAAVWRWHFYAGLFCIPFVLWLALTGSIYLFRPQIEAWLDEPYAHVATENGSRASAARQAQAAVAAVPGSVLHRYQLPETSAQAAQVIVGTGASETRVYVNPQTLAVLGAIAEDRRPMRVVFRLHGELLVGDPGSYLVELAASWAIVILVSGLFLWWPRGRGPAGVVYPRLGRGGRQFWRDLHAVTGFWVAAMALFLLISGLPWAKSWGSYLKEVRSVAEGKVHAQDWSAGSKAERTATALADAGTRLMLGEHAEHGGMAMSHPAASYAPLERIVAAVQPLRLAGPVLIAPPTRPGQPWTAKSDSANRPLRTDLTLDPATGAVLTRKDFAQRRLIDRLVGYGVAVHEGALFGWLNQLLNLTTSLGLALVSISGATMWWKRRPSGVLGAPPKQGGQLHAMGFFGLIVALGLLLPLFGASLLAVLAFDCIVDLRSGRPGKPLA